MGTSERFRRVVVVESGSEALGWVAHLLNHGLQVAWVDFDEETPREWLSYARRVKPSWTFLPQAWDTVEVRRISQSSEVLESADLVLYACPEPNWTTAYQATQPMVSGVALCAVNSLSGPWEAELEHLVRLRAPQQMRSHKLLEVSGIHTPSGAQVASLAISRLGRCTVGVKGGRPGVLQRLEVWLVNTCLKLAERHMLPLELVEAATSVLMPEMKRGLFRPLREFDAARHLLWSLEWGQDLPHNDGNNTLPRAISWLANVQVQNRSLFEPFFRPGDRDALVLDPLTLAYREPMRVEDSALAGLPPIPVGQRVRRLLASNSEAGAFLQDFFPRLLRLCEHLAMDLDEGKEGLDRLVQWGLGWECGPFALARELEQGEEPSEKRSVGLGAASLSPPHSAQEAVVIHQRADDLVEISWKDPYGVLNSDTVQRLLEAVRACVSPRIALLGGLRAFCEGVDYLEWLRLAIAREMEPLERQIAALQELGDLLAARDTVALVHGSARGFGLELALSCRTAIVQVECDLAFDHTHWGIPPCGGGCARLRARSWPSPKRVAELILDLALGWEADNAVLGKAIGLLREGDQVVLHPDGLSEAGSAWSPPKPEEHPWPSLSPLVSGMVDSGQSRSVRIGEMTEYDAVLGDRIKKVFRAGSHEEALQRERQAALESLREGRSLARLRYMLDHERPLRN